MNCKFWFGSIITNERLVCKQTVLLRRLENETLKFGVKKVYNLHRGNLNLIDLFDTEF